MVSRGIPEMERWPYLLRPSGVNDGNAGLTQRSTR